jgi:hypothetical protein
MEQRLNRTQTPKYVEVRVTIFRTYEDYAFGTAVINGAKTEIFVGSRSHGVKGRKGYWKATTPQMPSKGSVLTAKICTKVKDPGKRLFAVFWCITESISHSCDLAGTEQYGGWDFE